MKKEHILSIVILIAVWQLLAGLVQNDILIPYPSAVLTAFLSLFLKPEFYWSVAGTVLRILKGFLISLLSALLCSILAEESETFRRLFEPVQVILKTVPNVSYIIIALIWLGAEGAVSTVSFMILFPVFFSSFTHSFESEPVSQKDAAAIYEEDFLTRLRVKILPQMLPEILSTGRTAASLGLKVGVMAEILGQVRVGIGKQLYLSKIYLDTTRLLAWTAVIILVSVVFDQLFAALIHYRKKEELK
jgi:NitT/TauT family transport system permease protein